MKKGGLNYPGIPPPFVGTWERQFGEGVSKKIEGFRFTNNKKQPIRQTITNIRSTSLKKPKFVNKSLSNFDLIKWIKYFKINNFKRIFSRNEHKSEPEHSRFIINLDDLAIEGPGTHWVTCYPSKKIIIIFYITLNHLECLILKNIKQEQKERTLKYFIIFIIVKI